MTHGRGESFSYHRRNPGGSGGRVYPSALEAKYSLRIGTYGSGDTET